MLFGGDPIHLLIEGHGAESAASGIVILVINTICPLFALIPFIFSINGCCSLLIVLKPHRSLQKNSFSILNTIEYYGWGVMNTERDDVISTWRYLLR
jgi:hypothetical protein